MRPRLTFVVACIAVTLLSTTDVATANPGFDELGGRPARLGADELAPFPVVHRGRTYLAVVERHAVPGADEDDDGGRAREQLVVRRLADDGHWERVGGPLNHDLGADEILAPQLLAVDDVLYAAWGERPDDEWGIELRVARLEEPAGRWASWHHVGPSDAPEIGEDGAPMLQFLAIRGRPCAFFRTPAGDMQLGALIDRRWVWTDARNLVAFDGPAEIPMIAAYRDSVYLELRQTTRVPARLQGGELIPAREERRYRLLELEPRASGRVTNVRELAALDTGEKRLRMHHQPHSPPLLTLVGPGQIRVMRIERDRVVRFPSTILTPDLPRRVRAVQLGDGAAVVGQTGGRIVLFHLRGTAQTPVVERDPGPAGQARHLRLIAGPLGRPLLAYTNEERRTVVLSHACPPARRSMRRLAQLPPSGV